MWCRGHRKFMAPHWEKSKIYQPHSKFDILQWIWGNSTGGHCVKLQKHLDQLEASLKSNNTWTACTNIVAAFHAFEAVRVFLVLTK